MSEHTPGPWILDEVSEGQWDICNEEEEFISVIVEITTKIGSPSNELTEEDKANARLIAAAPDLLQFAKKVAYGDFTPAAWVQAAREVVAKATNQPE